MSFTFAAKKEKITKRENIFFQNFNAVFACRIGFGNFDGDNVCAWKFCQSDYGGRKK